MADGRLLALESANRRSLGDGDIVAGKIILRQQLAHFEFDEFEELLVVDEVDLVHEHDERRHADLAGEQDVLARLRHRAVGGGNDQDRAVHLGGTSDHVLHVVGVAGTIDVRIVAVGGLVLDVSRRDGDAARLLLRCLVDLIIGRVGRAAGLCQHLGDGSRQRGLAVVDVTDRADVAVRLVAGELLFTHRRAPSE